MIFCARATRGLRRPSLRAVETLSPALMSATLEPQLGDSFATAVSWGRKLPAEILNKLAMRFVERGIEHFPDLLLEFL